MNLSYYVAGDGAAMELAQVLTPPVAGNPMDDTFDSVWYARAETAAAIVAAAGVGARSGTYARSSGQAGGSNGGGVRKTAPQQRKKGKRKGGGGKKKGKGRRARRARTPAPRSPPRRHRPPQLRVHDSPLSASAAIATAAAVAGARRPSGTGARLVLGGVAVGVGVDKGVEGIAAVGQAMAADDSLGEHPGGGSGEGVLDGYYHLKRPAVLPQGRSEAGAGAFRSRELNTFGADMFRQGFSSSMVEIDEHEQRVAAAEAEAETQALAAEAKRLRVLARSRETRAAMLKDGSGSPSNAAAAAAAEQPRIASPSAASTRGSVPGTPSNYVSAKQRAATAAAKQRVSLFPWTKYDDAGVETVTAVDDVPDRVHAMEVLLLHGNRIGPR